MNTKVHVDDLGAVAMTAARASAATRLAVVRAERPLRDVVPPTAPWQIVSALGVERVVDAVVAFGSLAPDEQDGVAIPIVEEGVARPRTRGEGREIASAHAVDLAVDPRIDLAF